MVDYQLQLIVLPVSDVDRSREFYRRIGFREEVVGGHPRLTPPGSGCSIAVRAAPGPVENLHLVVADIEEARAELVAKGVEVSEIFHDEGGVFHHGGTEIRVPGLYPGLLSYGSFASFADPDGNGFLLQEVSERFPE